MCMCARAGRAHFPPHVYRRAPPLTAYRPQPFSGGAVPGGASPNSRARAAAAARTTIRSLRIVQGCTTTPARVQYTGMRSPVQNTVHGPRRTTHSCGLRAAMRVSFQRGGRKRCSIKMEQNKPNLWLSLALRREHTCPGDNVDPTASTAQPLWSAPASQTLSVRKPMLAKRSSICGPETPWGQWWATGGSVAHSVVLMELGLWRISTQNVCLTIATGHSR